MKTVPDHIETYMVNRLKLRQRLFTGFFLQNCKIEEYFETFNGISMHILYLSKKKASSYLLIFMTGSCQEP